jgi:hypothetical protein
VWVIGEGKVTLSIKWDSIFGRHDHMVFMVIRTIRGVNKKIAVLKLKGLTDVQRLFRAVLTLFGHAERTNTGLSKGSQSHSQICVVYER